MYAVGPVLTRTAGRSVVASAWQGKRCRAGGPLMAMRLIVGDLACSGLRLSGQDGKREHDRSLRPMARERQAVAKGLQSRRPSVHSS